jgi:hypothetical protein
MQNRLAEKGDEFRDLFLVVIIVCCVMLAAWARF